MEENRQESIEIDAQTSPFANGPYDVSVVPAPVKPPNKRKSRKLWRIFLAAGIVVAMAVAAFIAGAFCINAMWQKRAEDIRDEFDKKIESMQMQMDQMKQNTPAVDPDAPEKDIPDIMLPSQVYAKNVNAVVAISNQSVSTNIFGQVSQTASSGSGFIISDDGYVVSNYHVVEGASKLTVILATGTEYDAELVGYDASNDISVLKIDAKNLPFVKVGDSDALVVGDRVAAIGNPLGELTSSMTVGYVSAKDRNVNTDGTILNMLQTDAAINSGNSGGPLFNMYGEVVGITTAKYSGTSNSGATIEGIGFAIPINDVSGMIQDIINKGYVSGGYLGVGVEDVSAEDARKYGMPYGALVTQINPDSAAERGGLQEHDIIIKLGNRDVDSVNALTRALRDYEAGDEVEITVYRSGAEVELKVTLDEKPQQDAETVPEQTQPDDDGSLFPFDGYENFLWPFFGP